MKTEASEPPYLPDQIKKKWQIRLSLKPLALASSSDVVLIRYLTSESELGQLPQLAQCCRICVHGGSTMPLDSETNCAGQDADDRM